MANITINNVRLSYVHLTKPYANDPAGDQKYSCTVLLPKSDAESKKRIDAAIAAAIEQGRTTKWAGVVPPIVGNPIHDGDGVKQDGSAYGAECKGCWVFTASSSAERPPEIVDRQLNKILDHTQIYSGMYANICLNFYPYMYQGKKGIGCGLGPVQKVGDGEALGGATPAAASVFSAMAPEGSSFAAMGTEVPANGANINPLTGLPF